MPVRFQPVIKRARVGTPGFSADTMLRIGNIVRNSIAARMDRAEDVNDNKTAPLAESYLRRKQKKSERGTTVRDLYFTGRTRRSMKVTRAEHNAVVIGFTDDVARQRIAIQNRRFRQFGLSPSDKILLYKEVETYLGDSVVIEQKLG